MCCTRPGMTETPMYGMDGPGTLRLDEGLGLITLVIDEPAMLI